MVKADAKTFLAGGMIPSLDASEREVRRLFWRDDMENYNVCKWTPFWPAGVAVGYVNTPISAFEGDYVLRANHPTEIYYEVMSPRFGCFKPQKTGLELRWWYDATTVALNVGQFYLSPDGARQFRAVIRWSNGVWWYWSSTGAYVNIPGGSEALVSDSWNYLKIIVDWENRRYDRLITNFLDLDLTKVLPDPTLRAPWGMGLNPEISIALGQFYVVLGFSKTAVNQPSYVDDVRLYLNEV
jgi:hypothetical protein